MRSQQQPDDAAGRAGSRGAGGGSQHGSDTEAKSYRYLRTAMVGLLVALAVAVFYQSWRQGSFLASVSAYYYTPAQAVLVGALIGLGACMIAVQGRTGLEDVSLNLGGVFAAVVAVVPAARGADYQTAVRACQEAGTPLLTEKASNDLDCPTVQALADATRANVENNMAALLAIGLLAIVAAAVFVWRDRKLNNRVDNRAVSWGLAAAVVLWLSGLIAVMASIDWFIQNAHYLAGAGLLGSVLVVAVLNARRHEMAQSGDAPGRGRRANVADVLLSPRRYRYTWIAGAIVIVALTAIVMMLTSTITLFWLEIAVAALFAVFWIVQTIELE